MDEYPNVIAPPPTWEDYRDAVLRSASRPIEWKYRQLLQMSALYAEYGRAAVLQEAPVYEAAAWEPELGKSPKWYALVAKSLAASAADLYKED